MDRQLLERMIGAVVLIGLLVIVAPALLDGDGERASDTDSTRVAAPVVNEGERKTHTIRLDEEADRPPVARVVPPEVAQEPANEAEAALAPPEVVADPTESAAVAPAPKPADVVEKAAPPASVKKPEPIEVAPPPAVVEAVPTEGWAVQLGSFSQRENAQRLAAEVEAKGFATFLMPMEKDGATLYRVRVGPKPDRGAAEKLAAKLAADGYMGRPVPQNPES